MNTIFLEQGTFKIVIDCEDSIWRCIPDIMHVRYYSYDHLVSTSKEMFLPKLGDTIMMGADGWYIKQYI